MRPIGEAVEANPPPLGPGRSNVVDLDISDVLDHHLVLCAVEYSPTGVCQHPKMIRNSEGAALTPPTSIPSLGLAIPCGGTLCRTNSPPHLLPAQLALRNKQVRHRRCLDAISSHVAPLETDQLGVSRRIRTGHGNISPPWPKGETDQPRACLRLFSECARALCLFLKRMDGKKSSFAGGMCACAL